METNFHKCISKFIYHVELRTQILYFSIQNTGYYFFGNHCNILQRVSILTVNLRLHFLLKKESELVTSNINGRNHTMLK